jgi:hypothetical protein
VRNDKRITAEDHSSRIVSTASAYPAPKKLYLSDKSTFDSDIIDDKSDLIYHVPTTTLFNLLDFQIPPWYRSSASRRKLGTI